MNNMDKNMAKANVLIQALPYIQSYYGKTVVVKYGGNAMISQSLKDAVISDLILMSCVGIKVVVVHGGGPEINGFLNKIGKESKFINGLRVTDEETIDVVQMVLAGKVNKDIVALIDKSGGKAIGICGMDASLLKAKKKLGKDDADIGYVGEITEVNEEIVTHCLEDGYIPVISTIALGEEDGMTYNINADYAAARIAAKLKAEKLILLTDVPGILQDEHDEQSLISILKLQDFPVLMRQGIIRGGMIPKLECCIEAIREGVKKAHIIDGRVAHSILLEMFSDQGVGTMIC